MSLLCACIEKAQRKLIFNHTFLSEIMLSIVVADSLFDFSTTLG